MSDDDRYVYYSRRSEWPPPEDSPDDAARSPYEPLDFDDPTPRIIPTQRGDGPRHRRSGARSGSRHAHPILRSLLVVVLLVVAGAVVWWLREDRPDLRTAMDRLRGRDPVPTPAAAGCAAARLRVAVTPDIAPIVQEAARASSPGAGDCGPYAVTAEESSVTAGNAPGNPPDLWIPSSSAWLRIAASDGARYAAHGPALARTPIVLAAPKNVAVSPPDGDRARWSDVVAGAASRRLPSVTMADPLRSTVGLLSVLAVRSAMARTTDDQGIAQLRALTLRSRLADPAADPSTVLEKAAGGNGSTDDLGLFPVTEQQLWVSQQQSSGSPLTARYPSDAMVEADYPLAVSEGAAADADRRQLIERLTTRLRSAESSRALTSAGFRLPAGGPVPKGLPKTYPKPMSLPRDPAQLLGSALQWSQYRTLSYQVLLLVDASGSMNARVPDRSGGTTTKATLLRESGVNAAQLFGEETSIGMWYFGTPKATSPAYADVVPFGPITTKVDGTPRRALLAGAIARYRAAPDAGTPLYRTILDGVQAMRKRAKPDTITMVVVLTDGNDEGSRFAMTRQEFLSRLDGVQDTDRPVPIFGVGYGPDADLDTLRQLAKATGGQAIAAVEPADLASAMAKVFLAAHAPD
jgi:hypothetical protein